MDLSGLSNAINMMFKYTPIEVAALRQHDEAFTHLDVILKTVFDTTAEPYKGLKASQLIIMRNLLLTGHFTVEAAHELATERHVYGSAMDKLSTGELTINQVRESFGLQPMALEGFDAYMVSVKGLDE